MIKALREEVRRLFEEKKVDLVIGWGKGSLPMTATPVFIHKAEDVEQLIWDETCSNNLAVYLTKDKRQLVQTNQKIGIVVKGCDGRSLVLYAVENQIKRENLVIIGVPCNGVIDKKKVLKQTEGKEVLSARFEKERMVVEGRGFKTEITKSDMLSRSCIHCNHPNAPVYDIFIGEPINTDSDVAVYPDVEAFEKLDCETRWKDMVESYSQCIRCYACRNVCPSCYCTECFVDQNDPQWIGKSPEITDTLIFHLNRNLHVAGRCVECGACERACPADIDLLRLNRKISKEILERFNFTAGLDIDEKPALASFCENEKQDFIMG